MMKGFLLGVWGCVLSLCPMLSMHVVVVYSFVGADGGADAGAAQLPLKEGSTRWLRVQRGALLVVIHRCYTCTLCRADGLCECTYKQQVTWQQPLKRFTTAARLHCSASSRLVTMLVAHVCGNPCWAVSYTWFSSHLTGACATYS